MQVENNECILVATNTKFPQQYKKLENQELLNAKNKILQDSDLKFRTLIIVSYHF